LSALAPAVWRSRNVADPGEDRKRDNIRLLVVGLGNMGLSRALAYQKLDSFEIVGLVVCGINGRTGLPDSFGNYPGYTDFDVALSATRPDVVSINTWPDTCAGFAI